MRAITMLKRGFTLVELLIFMGLMTVLLLVLTQIFVSVLDARLDSEAVSSVEQDGNFIMARLMYDAFRSSNVTTPASAGSQGNILVLVIGGINYTYTINGANLQVTNNFGTDQINGYNSSISNTPNSNLMFKRLGNGASQDSIVVTFRVTSNTLRRGGSEFKDFQTTLSPRQ